MTSATGALPRWDLSDVYPSPASLEFAAGFDAVVRAISNLGELFDRLQIGQREPAPLDDATVAGFEEVVGRLNLVLEEVQTLDAYLYGLVTTDSRDDVAQARQSELEQQQVRLHQLGTRFTAWVGSLDVEALIARSEVARAHAYPLQLAKQAAAHLMSPAEEALAAELSLSGGSAWGKLHGNVSSQILVRLEADGESADVPVSAARNQAFAADRETRRRAYEAELSAWEANALPLAAALNGVKGEVNTLVERRRWGSPLDEALVHNHVDRHTLDAMLAAAREAFPDFRRYLKAKARALGLPALAWYDLFAPLGAGERVWSYEEAAVFIAEQFGGYSDRMRDFALRAFHERWIDAEPRPGKRDGGYCMAFRGDESRILVNYTAAYDGVNTLAHELGHAYHNLNEATRTMLQRDTPPTLAETASTFCETILRHAALGQTAPAEQLPILEGSLQDACQIVVDISSRFLFEQRVFEQRRQRELSVDELKDFMLDAQRATYGDGLDPDVLHPFMWAVKGHYYSTDGSFYNFPYMFGLLFGLGLYARYRVDPEGFKTGYDDLLAATGLADAATLAARFGIDIRAPAFWRSSLDILRADIDRFERLVAGGAWPAASRRSG